MATFHMITLMVHISDVLPILAFVAFNGDPNTSVAFENGGSDCDCGHLTVRP